MIHVIHTNDARADGCSSVDGAVALLGGSKWAFAGDALLPIVSHTSQAL